MRGHLVDLKIVNSMIVIPQVKYSSNIDSKTFYKLIIYNDEQALWSNSRGGNGLLKSYLPTWGKLICLYETFKGEIRD